MIIDLVKDKVLYQTRVLGKDELLNGELITTTDMGDYVVGTVIRENLNKISVDSNILVNRGIYDITKKVDRSIRVNTSTTRLIKA